MEQSYQKREEEEELAVTAPVYLFDFENVKF